MIWLMKGGQVTLHYDLIETGNNAPWSPSLAIVSGNFCHCNSRGAILSIEIDHTTKCCWRCQRWTLWGTFACLDLITMMLCHQCHQYFELTWTITRALWSFIFIKWMPIAKLESILYPTLLSRTSFLSKLPNRKNKINDFFRTWNEII